MRLPLPGPSAISALMITGSLCIGSPARSQEQPELHSVTWYQAHRDVLQRDLAWCQDNPGVDAPPCRAARIARLNLDYDAIAAAAKKAAP